MIMPTPKMTPLSSAPERLPRGAHVQRTGHDQQLHHHHRTEGQQPNGELVAELAMPELDHRHAQAKARSLGGTPKPSPASRPHTANTAGSPKRSVQPAQSMIDGSKH
jgi:hypothetical protein